MTRSPGSIGGLATLFVIAALIAPACGSPTAPDRRTGPVTVAISCTPRDARISTCSANVSCGLYGCPPNTPADATASSTWTSENPSIVRVVSAGVVEAIATGDTVIRTSHALAGDGSRSLSVFPGTAPLATYALAGSVVDGSDAARPPLNGATVQVLTGLVAGKTAVSGIAPPFLPGFWQPGPNYPPGSFDIFGVPQDTYRLRVFKTGYVTEERDVTGLSGHTFVLQRQ